MTVSSGDLCAQALLDTDGGIEWVLFRRSGGLMQPILVISDWQLTDLCDRMDEERRRVQAATAPEGRE